MASTSLVKKKFALKRSLTYHLAGIGNDKGLVFKSYAKLNKLIDSNDEAIALQAIDKVIKLMAYAIEKETPQALLATGNGTVLNVQINNFDSFIKDRLSNTNLGKLLNNIELQPAPQVNSHIEEASFVDVTPPPNPGGSP